MVAYRPLPHSPGAWGVITDDAKAKRGQIVTIVTKAGNTKKEMLGDMLYERRGIYVFTLQQ